MSHSNGSTSNREAALLLACLRHRLGKPDLEAVRQTIAPQLNWRRLIELAHSHRVVALVYAVLSKIDEGIPDEVLAELRADYHASALETLFLVRQLLQLVNGLESEGIGVIPFKGPILASEVHGDFAMRSVGDLDLLVHHADVIRARQWFVAKRFTPVFPTGVPREQAYLASLTGRRLEEYILTHAEHHLASPDGRVAVDLHWGIALKEYALPLDTEQLFANARQVDLAGSKIRTLAAEDLLVVLCINGAKDNWNRLDRICDVAALLTRYPQLDWPRVLSAARDAGAERILRVTLALVADLLKTAPVPATDRTAVRLAAEIRSRLFMPNRRDADGIRTFAEVKFQLRLRDRLRDRLRFLAAQFSPTVGDWAACPLPEQLRMLHYIVRPVRLFLDRTATMPASHGQQRPARHSSGT